MTTQERQNRKQKRRNEIKRIYPLAVAGVASALSKLRRMTHGQLERGYCQGSNCGAPCHGVFCNVHRRDRRASAMALVCLLFMLSAFGLSAQANTFTTNGCVTLIWNASPSETGDTNTEFYVLHGTTNLALPLIEWPIIATVPAGTNQGNVFFPVVAACFYLTFSNAWGESGPSNQVCTPQAPMPPMSLRILRLRE